MLYDVMLVSAIQQRESAINTHTHTYRYVPSWVAPLVKESPCQCRKYKRCRFDHRVRKIPQRRKWQPILVVLPGESHRQRSLVGYRPQGCKESDTNEKLNYHHSLTNFMKLILSKLRTVGTAQSQMTVSVSNSILMSNIL